MKKQLLIFLLFSLLSNIQAQKVWQVDLQPVSKSGYYNIELQQNIVVKSEDQILSDLKILDEKGKEVPYFLRPKNPVKEISYFEDYTLKQNTVKDSLNIVVVDNSNSESISRFYVVLHRADVNKYASIRGSNDLKQWYIVKKRENASNLWDKWENNSEILYLDFPQGNYKYYEIVLENDQRSPLEVIKVGKIKNSSVYGQFTEVDLSSFVQKDSINKKTYLKFPNLSDVYCISKLEFVINNKAYYLRQALITDSVYGGKIAFDLSSKSSNNFFIDNFILSRNTSIVIENHNNPPLTIDSIKGYGLNRYLCAYLEEGKRYSLQVGEKDGAAPVYDIEHFQNDIASDLPIISATNLRFVADNTPQPRELIWIEKPLFMWGIIIAVGLLLLFICVKMIADMKKKN